VAGAANFFNKFELLAKKFVNKYLEYKKKLSKLEMQDLELISHLILNQESSLGEAFAQEWDYWLIDEYQDTSPLQEALLKKLIGKSPSYIVGDPQQSIYLFRGARSEVFARKEQELINKRERLSKNYRSYSELLSFINDLFSHFEQSFMKMDFSHRYGEPQEERVVAKFYNGNDKKFVAKEVLGLMQQGISPEKICVLSR
ncbi:MAG: UvrD-helicase domain-containing protein, partial [Bdellovibrionales bacterium]|nr:UvrD-helicase domain-containing protein [Bdellovibrionales bacterium]